MYPPFQNSHEFALDGGVIFDTLVNSSESHADAFKHFSVQQEFDF